MVFGEEPYAEFSGDRKHLGFSDEEGLGLLRKFKAEGVPTVAVFLSGRPMWVNRELNVADAFVASWLPGSEGAGIADVLTGAQPATGKLGFSWPATCDFGPLNGPDGALFPVGYGRSLDDTAALPMLDETCDALLAGDSSEWFVSGRFATGISASAGGTDLPNLRGSAGGVSVRGIDRNAQEDSREITFAPGSSLTIAQDGEGAGAYRIVYRVKQRPSQPVTVTTGTATVDLTQPLSVAAEKDWREMIITEQCAAGLGDSLTFTSAGAFSFDIATIAREELAEGTDCSF